MKPKALDANIVLRFVTADHPEMSPRCRALFARIQGGEEVVFLPEAALSDVVWTLRSFYHWPADQICGLMGNLLALDGIQMARKPLVWEAVSLFAEGGIDFSDALIVAEMHYAGLSDLYSYDHDFDRLTDVTRIEP